MNKEEILAKAQQENKFGDEREQLILLKANDKACNFGILFCSLMYLLTMWAGNARWEFFHVYFVMQAAQYIHRAWYLRKKQDILFAVLYGISSIALTVVYIYKQVLGR